MMAGSVRRSMTGRIYDCTRLPSPPCSRVLADVREESIYKPLAKSRQEAKKASKCWPFVVVVRKERFEPPRSCDRQPLKLDGAKLDYGRATKIGVSYSS
jgi:hypothetical protein